MLNEIASYWQNLVEASLGARAPHYAAFAAEPPAHIKIRAVLTDFDGVIGDNERLIREAYAKLQAQKNGALPDVETALSYAENPRAFLKEHISEEQRLELLEQGRMFYEQTPIHLLDGAEQTMQHYQNAHIPWAVVSNNMNTRRHWQELGLDKVFPDTLVLDHAQKPSTFMLEKALAALGEAPGNDVIMVDDGWKGLVAAAKLGLTPVYLGSEAHIVLPQVAQALQQEGLSVPPIPIVRNNQELQQLLTVGIELSPSVNAAVQVG